MRLNLNDTSSAICDLMDVRRALPKKIKDMPKDNDGTDITIGECLDDVLNFLENIYEQGHEGEQ